MKLKSTLLACALPLLSGYAGAYCIEPTMPYCVSSYDKFDQYSYATCKREMKTHEANILQYQECVKQDAQNLITQSMSNYSEAIRKFNCKASGQEMCY